MFRQNVPRLRLFTTHLTVPLEMAGEVNRLDVVLDVHLPLVAKTSAAASVSPRCLHNIEHEVVIIPNR